MKTGFLDRAEVGARKTVGNFIGIITPDLAAQKALADIKKGRDMSVYGFYVKLTHLLSKIVPQEIVMRAWLMQQGIK